jgi:hypothetical protein
MQLKRALVPNRPADSLAAISPSVGSRAQFPALTNTSCSVTWRPSTCHG